MGSRRLAAVALVVTVITTLLLVFEWVASRLIDKRIQALAFPVEFQDFYLRHYTELNHLRAPFELQLHRAPQPGTDHKSYVDEPELLMFSKLGNGNTVVLIQGDSWAERFDSTDESRALIENLAAQGYTFVLAGAASYSPSLMTVQFRKLVSECGVTPQYVIAIVDQTDIGDELCRYRKQRDYVDGKLIIHPFSLNETFSLGPFFRYTAILNSQEFSTIKLFRLALRTLDNLVDRRDEKAGCGWDGISRPLREGTSREEDEWFVRVVLEYIDMVFSVTSVSHLEFVSHPHRQHLTGEYKLNVSELLSRAILASKHRDRIALNAFLKESKANYTADELSAIYLEGDLASHLNKEYHANVYVKKILENIVR